MKSFSIKKMNSNQKSLLEINKLIQAAKHMDWMQVVLNQGPPCFHLEDTGRFCGRAERWHDKAAMEMFHAYVSLEDLLRKISVSPLE